MHECMKTITIRDETYHDLAGMKESADSFSDVIDRLISRKRTDIREYAGALRDSKVMDELDSFTKRVRKSGRARV
jgi:predicted CopG family antitoxin